MNNSQKGDEELSLIRLGFISFKTLCYRDEELSRRDFYFASPFLGISLWIFKVIRDEELSRLG
jgi:hypothetical protein